ncbi:hypothetical protein QFZ60_001320 [Arthrobacter sp. B2I5]|nr:hypothetical protein [Arthrobacter sp. B2I5]
MRRMPDRSSHPPAALPKSRLSLKKNQVASHKRDAT